MIGYRAGEVIYAIMCAALISGIILIFRDDFRVAFMRMKMKRRLRTRQAQNRSPDFLTLHLRMMMQAVSGGRFTDRHLITVSAVIFASVAATAIRSCSLTAAVFFGLLIGSMPYVLCRIKLESMRHRASFEGEGFVALILTKYRMASLNMREALELAAADEKAPGLCGRLLVPVVLGTRAAGDEDRIKEAFKSFEFAVNTNWSRMTVYNMANSFISGMDVTDALEDILLQLREARTLSEERRRMNSEAVNLVMVMAPLSYVISLALAVKYVGVSAGTLFHNQFFTPQGFAFFVFIVFMFLANIALLKIVENRRFDY